ncbi:DUF1330 domain-containing protein [Paraburkholderia ultramafica]|uniref:DUF1330 domain-containing protein n=1 Tax=Paraburkholderia ultramafica TaxID=1544867 RepID=UPI003CCCF9E6
MMMLEFPSFDDAKTWYTNPSYQAACEHRFKGGIIALSLLRVWHLPCRLEN